MTTLVEAENVVLSQWITEWGTTTPFAFTEERQPSTVSRGETDWALVQVVDVEREQQTLNKDGIRRFLSEAVVSITIYTPSGKGTARALALAQQAREVFEGKRIGVLSFLPAQVERLGSIPPEYLVLVTCPFDYTEVK